MKETDTLQYLPPNRLNVPQRKPVVFVCFDELVKALPQRLKHEAHVTVAFSVFVLKLLVQMHKMLGRAATSRNILEYTDLILG